MLEYKSLIVTTSVYSTEEDLNLRLLNVTIELCLEQRHNQKESSN